MYPQYPQKQHQQLQPHLTTNQPTSFLMPTQNQNNRAVFSSMIQPPTNSQQTPKSGLSKL